MQTRALIPCLKLASGLTFPGLWGKVPSSVLQSHEINICGGCQHIWPRRLTQSLSFTRRISNALMVCRLIFIRARYTVSAKPKEHGKFRTMHGAIWLWFGSLSSGTWACPFLRKLLNKRWTGWNIDLRINGLLVCRTTLFHNRSRIKFR